MGSRLKTARAGLSEYWGTRRRGAERAGTGRRIAGAGGAPKNISARSTRTLKMPVITPVFKEIGMAAPAFFAKKPAGPWPGHRSKQGGPADLQGFSAGGYRYAPDASEGETMVFMQIIPRPDAPPCCLRPQECDAP